MGSALAKPRTPSYARELFLHIHRLTEVAAATAEEPDMHAVRDVFADGLANPESREAVLMAIAVFVASSFAGSVPNPAKWEPPAK